jgi:hypothetical protein
MCVNQVSAAVDPVFLCTLMSATTREFSHGMQIQSEQALGVGELDLYPRALC